MEEITEVFTLRSDTAGLRKRSIQIVPMHNIPQMKRSKGGHRLPGSCLMDSRNTLNLFKHNFCSHCSNFTYLQPNHTYILLRDILICMLDYIFIHWKVVWGCTTCLGLGTFTNNLERWGQQFLVLCIYVLPNSSDQAQESVLRVTNKTLKHRNCEVLQQFVIWKLSLGQKFSSQRKSRRWPTLRVIIFCWKPLKFTNLRGKS